MASTEGIKRDTKTIIWEEALTLFALKGYEGVSMRDIAEAVGIKAASLYKHYQSKEEIFEKIMLEMSAHYNSEMTKIQMPSGDVQRVAEQYMHMSEELLVSVAKGCYLFFLNDEVARKFRQMLTIEQYRSSKAGAMFKAFFIEDVLTFQTHLFEIMIQMGGFKPCDPHVMAMQFYAPIFLMLTLYDNQEEKKEEGISILEKHVRQFARIYSKEEH